MTRFAIINAQNKVENIAEADEAFAATQGWIAADNTVRIGDMYLNGSFIRVLSDEQNKTVSPVRFKLLFTQDERIAIKAARVDDTKLDDFYTLLDDPRLTIVDLALPATQVAVTYALNKVASTLNYTAQQVTDRLNEIVSGVMK